MEESITPTFDVASELKLALERNKSIIVERAMESIIKDMQHSITYAAKEVVQSTVMEFVKAEIVPNMQQTLQANRTEIIAAFDDVVLKAITAVGEQMVANVHKNLAYSFKADEVITKLFKS
jgi:diphthamide biosynthesis methyltransferase